MRAWLAFPLLFAVVIQLAKSIEFNYKGLCGNERVLVVEELLRLCKIYAPESLPLRYRTKEKRFLRFGRALSGDIFLRIGRPDLSNYAYQDKRFLRFGRNDESSNKLLHDAMQGDSHYDVSSRKKRSVNDDETGANNTEKPTLKILKDLIEEEDNGDNYNSFGRSGNVEHSDLEKRFMRFGRDSADVDLAKRFMRFGRTPDIDKRFMRFGRAQQAQKRFMRFGRDAAKFDKRFMRFGRTPEAEKRFMRFGRDPNMEKRFMRFGRAPTAYKKFLRFGRDPGSNNAKRFMRFGH